MTTNMHAKCVCPHHLNVAGVHAINQLARVATWPHTKPKLGARHRKEPALPGYLEWEGCSIQV